MTKERVAMYIDGGNTYRKLKDLGIPEEGKRFDFNAFAIHLLGDRALVSSLNYSVNEKKKNVEYIGFAGSPSFGMIRESKVQRILTKSDLLPFQYDKLDTH